MPSEKKKNPFLGPIMEETFNLEYINHFNYLFVYKGIESFKNLDLNERKKKI